MRALAVPGLATALFLAGCHSAKPVPQPPPAVRVLEVDGVGNLTQQIRYSAVVLPDTQVPLAFRVPGYVISIGKARGPDGVLREFAEGDRVAKGATLATLRPAEYREKVQQATGQASAATAAAGKAQLDFERATRLYQAQSITKPEYDAARAQYDATQAQLHSAQALRAEANVALRDTRLVSPVNGDIIKKAVEVGSLAGAGTLGFVVADTRTVKIMIGVPDVTLRTLKLGMPTVVTTEALPNRTFNARITRISAAADPRTRNFDVEIAIPNPKGELKAGMIAAVELSNQPQPRSMPTLVPLSAIIQSQGGGYAVFIVGSDNVAYMRAIQVGDVFGNQVAAAGVNHGDKVITTGAQIVRDGQRVEVLR